jgi:hypothetical protein
MVGLFIPCTLTTGSSDILTHAKNDIVEAQFVIVTQPLLALRLLTV